MMNSRILFVDDEINVLSAYQRNLRTKFDVHVSSNPVEALGLLKNEEPFSVIVSDFKMPEMNGSQFLSKAKTISKDSVRILLTGYADLTSAIEAVNEGNIFRFLTKPCPTDMLISNLNNAIEQYRLITHEKELLEKTLNGSIKVLIDILSTVNPIAFGKAARLNEIVKKLSASLDVKLKWKIETAAMLSQIGCVTIPNDILTKVENEEPISQKEMELFLSHPAIGKSILQNIPRLEEISQAIFIQASDIEDYSIYSKDNDINEIEIISKILKHAIEIDGKNQFKKFAELRAVHNYDFLNANKFETIVELDNTGKKYGLCRKKIFEIKIKSILAEDIIANDGMLLIVKGQEVTPLLLIRLENFVKLKKIKDPIKVYQPI